jgi:hypothetical protein
MLAGLHLFLFRDRWGGFSSKRAGRLPGGLFRKFMLADVTVLDDACPILERSAPRQSPRY